MIDDMGIFRTDVGISALLVMLGAQTLEGLNLRVDLTRRELVPRGPLPAAAAA
jgi:hypothetical protein